MKRPHDHLTKCELLELLEVIHRSLLITTDVELQDLLLCIRNIIPCANIIAGLARVDHDGHFEDSIKIVNVSYPPEWLALYLERGYAAIDPVLQSHFGGFKTQVWSETFRRVTSQKQKAFVKEAEQFGLSQGITLGIACRRHPAGSLFSFANHSVARHIRHEVILEYLVPHLHIALMRSVFPPSGEAPILSVREREVLEWMKEGKTNWEISQILQVSERTVKFHVQNILTKVQATSRGHAVALAMEHGLIGL